MNVFLPMLFVIILASASFGAGALLAVMRNRRDKARGEVPRGYNHPPDHPMLGKMEPHSVIYTEYSELWVPGKVFEATDEYDVSGTQYEPYRHKGIDPIDWSLICWDKEAKGELWP